MSSIWSGVLPVLVLAVVFVNGWTDAPNAIASAVTTKAISFRSAALMAAVCNLLGLLVVSFISVSVADTVTSMVDFGAAGLRESEAALCASMISIVLFASCAWYFGIPISESHALPAALTGASLALGGSGPSHAAWAKIITGLGMSLILGSLSGYLSAKFLKNPLEEAGGSLLDKFQVAAAAGSAFMHGAQDGQKFAAVLVAARMMQRQIHTGAAISIWDHLPIFLLCGAVMAIGTGVGGKRIVLNVGEKMASIEKYQGVCSDIGSVLCLLLASLTGIPMSTTHTKTSAIMGAGAAGSIKSVNFAVVRGMIGAWIFTFPVCGVIGYLLTRLILLR